MGFWDFLLGAKNIKPQKQPTKTAEPMSAQHNKENKKEAYLLLFSASWCGPSKMFIRDIEKGGIHNYNLIDAEAHEDLCAKYNIRSVPTTLLVKTTGEVVKKWEGYDSDDPGQLQFVSYIKNCDYHIIPYGLSFSSSSVDIRPYVESAISTFESGNIPLLQQKLFGLFGLLNKPGSGKLITGYPQKDKLCECFMLCLQYDWMHDSDIREVWAEDGFYCIVEYMKTVNDFTDTMVMALDLFLLCVYGGRDLKTKFNDILIKARHHPFDSARFTADEYQGGADYLVREFKFFGTTLLASAVRQHPQIISEGLKAEYDSARMDIAFASVAPESIIDKMNFISTIIGSILDDM